MSRNGGTQAHRVEVLLARLPLAVQLRARRGACLSRIAAAGVIAAAVVVAPHVVTVIISAALWCWCGSRCARRNDWHSSVFVRAHWWWRVYVCVQSVLLAVALGAVACGWCPCTMLHAAPIVPHHTSDRRRHTCVMFNHSMTGWCRILRTTTGHTRALHKHVVPMTQLSRPHPKRAPLPPREQQCPWFTSGPTPAQPGTRLTLPPTHPNGHQAARRQAWQGAGAGRGAGRDWQRSRFEVVGHAAACGRLTPPPCAVRLQGVEKVRVWWPPTKDKDR